MGKRKHHNTLSKYQHDSSRYTAPDARGHTMDPRPDPDAGKVHTSSYLLTQAASILQIDLHKTAQGIRGFARRTFDIGGAKLEGDVLAIVDETNATRCTVLCRIRKNLWLYAFVTMDHSAIIFFDGSKAALSVGSEGSFCTGSAMKTLEKIKAAATAGFRINQGTWVSADLAKMFGT